MAVASSSEFGEQVVEGLGEGGVGEHAISQRRIGYLAHHRYLEHGRYLAAFDPEDRTAQDPTRIRVHDGFYHAARLAHLERPGHVAHRHPGYADVEVFLASFLLAQTHPPELRVRKDGVGDQTPRGGGVATVQEVGLDDAVVVVGDVGEGRATLHVAQGPDVRQVGLEPLVNLDEA